MNKDRNKLNASLNRGDQANNKVPVAIIEENKQSIIESSGIKTLKLVLVGDTAVGKSAMITNYLKNVFDEDNYEPTVLDVYKGVKNINKRQVEVEI